MDDFIVSNFQKKNEVMPFEFYSLIKIVEGFYISLTSEKMKQKHVWNSAFFIRLESQFNSLTWHFFHVLFKMIDCT